MEILFSKETLLVALGSGLTSFASYMLLLREDADTEEDPRIGMDVADGPGAEAAMQAGSNIQSSVKQAIDFFLKTLAAISPSNILAFIWEKITDADKQELRAKENRTIVIVCVGSLLVTGLVWYILRYTKEGENRYRDAVVICLCNVPYFLLISTFVWKRWFM